MEATVRRSKPFVIRWKPHEMEAIRQAARIVHESPTEFIREAAKRRIEKVQPSVS